MNDTCSFPSCENPVRCKGVCKGHYDQRIKGLPAKPLRTAPIEVWFKWHAKPVESGCWEWGGTIDANGYGRIRHKKTLYLAHRLSHELHKGAIPNGHVIDHMCRNTKCVNPAHLRAGTTKQNLENRPHLRSNKSGYRGVSWSKNAKKWRVQVASNDIDYDLGYFDDLEEAAEVARQGRAKYHTFSIG